MHVHRSPQREPRNKSRFDCIESQKRDGHGPITHLLDHLLYVQVVGRLQAAPNCSKQRSYADTTMAATVAFIIKQCCKTPELLFTVVGRFNIE